MGREIVRVPAGFRHPADEAGEPIPGAHLEPLWGIPDAERPGYQVYENVSEGTPVSPAFDSVDELRAWLIRQGVTAEAADAFLRDGFAPSFVYSIPGGLVGGMPGRVQPQNDG